MEYFEILDFFMQMKRNYSEELKWSKHIKQAGRLGEETAHRCKTLTMFE